MQQIPHDGSLKPTDKHEALAREIVAKWEVDHKINCDPDDFKLRNDLIMRFAAALQTAASEAREEALRENPSCVPRDNEIDIGGTAIEQCKKLYGKRHESYEMGFVGGFTYCQALRDRQRSAPVVEAGQTFEEKCDEELAGWRIAPVVKAGQTFEEWFITPGNCLGINLKEYAQKCWTAALSSKQSAPNVVLPERKIEPTEQSAENVDEFRYVRTWNRCLDEIRKLNPWIGKGER